jgi:hypothetical protein
LFLFRLVINIYQGLLENIRRIIFTAAVGNNIMLDLTGIIRIDLPDDEGIIIKQGGNKTLIGMNDSGDMEYL